MKNSIHYSPEAQNDMDEIWEYIVFELCNPQAAENTVNKIMDGDLMGAIRICVGYTVLLFRPLQDRKPLEIHMERSIKYCCKICC